MDPLERERELDAVSRFLAQLREGPAALVLSGDAGIGKTTVWSVGISRAAAQSYTVISCRPAESEVKLSYAALTDLMEGVLVQAIPHVPGPQRRALEVALLRADDAGPPVDRRAVSAAFLSVVRHLSSMAPVVVAIDDVQWIDGSSRSVLEFAFRRLRDEPIGALLTLRTGALAASTPLGLDVSLPAERRTEVIVGPLSPTGLHRVLERSGVALSLPATRRVWEATDGNPFFSLELARGLDAADDAVAHEPIPLPENLGVIVKDRIATVPVAERGALLAASALSVPTRALVESAIRADGGDVEALDRAIETGIIGVDGDRLRFAHPLLRAAAYDAASPRQRRAIHARLAEVVHGPEERARHLALASSGPDIDVAIELDAAATVAHGRGAPDAAAELVGAAVRLTPRDRVRDRGLRSLRAGGLLREAGDPAGCRRALLQALEWLPQGIDRANAFIMLAYHTDEDGDVGASAGLFEQARLEAAGDADLLCDVEQGLSMVSADQARSVAHARRAVGFAEHGHDPLMRSEAMANLALQESQLGQGIRLDIFDDLGSGIQPGVEHVRVARSSRWILGVLHLWSEHLPTARAILEQERDTANERGDQGALQDLLPNLVQVELSAGDWPAAARWSEEYLEVGSWYGAGTLARAHGQAALVAAHTGHREAVEANCAEASRLADAANVRTSLRTTGPLGLLELSEGHAELAAHLLRPAADLVTLGIREPSCNLFLTDLIEALATVGRIDEADALLRPYVRRARRLDRPRALSAAGRCRGLIAAARGDLPAARRALQRSAREHDRHGQPFELARTLLVGGEIDRRAKHKAEARASLESAEALFDRLGAAVWSERTRAELERIGGRPAAPTELTATERRVANLVAEGRTNKEVADALFISVYTVEGNLTRIYRKLGIRSRTELAARVGRHPEPTEGGSRSLIEVDSRDSS